MKALVAAWLALALGGCRSDPPLDVADGVELSRFQGKWFEIAKLPRPTQVGCEDTTTFYRLRSDGQLDITNQCQRDGALRSVWARAAVTDADEPAKLSIDVGGFYGDYWIVEVGDRYEYAVVGHPSRDYLWILSRTPTLSNGVLGGILDRANARHFDVSRLEYTVQH